MPPPACAAQCDMAIGDRFKTKSTVQVCIFFDNKLLRGNRALKYSSTDFDAFHSPNMDPLAVVGVDIKVKHLFACIVPGGMCGGLPDKKARVLTYLPANILRVFGPVVSERATMEQINWKDILPSPEDYGGMQPVRAGRTLCPEVAALHMFPGITATIIRNFLAPPLKGLVLMG